MAYMQLEYYNDSARLTPQELVHIRHAAAAKEQEILAAAQALTYMIETGNGTADFRQVLDRMTASVNTARVPKRFMTEAQPSRSTTSRSKQHERVFYKETHNRSYIQRLLRQRCRQRKISVIEDHYLQVPNSPLPLSYAAQQDMERARNHQGSRRRRGPTGSGYAPLFTKSKSATPSREMTPAETEALKFLTPPERSPKLETMEKLQEQAHYTPSDPMARVLFNEPKRMPNLHRRVPRNFTASCVRRPTCAFVKRCEGNEERVSKNLAPKEFVQWH